VLAVVIWAGLSLLRETDFYEEVIGDLRDELHSWVSWVLALIAVAALAGLLYLVVT
jgi:hypothetical protein